MPPPARRLMCAIALTLSGACADVVEPSEYERVMGTLAAPSVANVIVNPALVRQDADTWRLSAWTFGECDFARGVPATSVDGSTVTVALWEIRGPCEGRRRPVLGLHDVEVTLPEGAGTGRLVVQSDRFGYVVTHAWELERSGAEGSAANDGMETGDER